MNPRCALISSVISMAELEITVVDVSSDRRASFRFARSPVRIGRSPLNELVIDHEFVSGLHGVFRFGDADVSYVDMGSRNGSQLNREPLRSHTPTTVPTEGELAIGQLRLAVRLLPTAAVGDDEDDTTDPPPGRYTFGSSGATAAAVRAETTALPYGFDIARLSSELSPAPAPQLPPPPVALPAEPPAIEFPQLESPAEPVFAPMVGFTRVLPRSGPPSDPHTPPAMERLRAVGQRATDADAMDLVLAAATLLEQLVGKTIALRDSVQIEADEFGVRPFSGKTPLYREGDPARVLEHLLGAGPQRERLEEVARFFADVFAHQVAFLGALRDGVEALLERLHPDTAGIEPGLFGSGALKRYRERYEDEAGRAWHTILGAEFGRAYSELVSATVRPTVASQPMPIAEASPPPASRPQRPRLVVISGAIAVQRVSLERDEIIIGRAADCDVALDHPSISRRHARLALLAGVWSVHDLGSANGVFVNGEKFRVAELQAGDVLQFGQVQVRFETEHVE